MSFSEIIQQRLRWRSGSASPEPLRQLAFEVMMHAATLAGEDDAVIEPEHMITPILLTAARSYLLSAGQQARDARHELAALRAENARLRQAIARDPRTVASGAEADPPAIARELIAMSDRLAQQNGDQRLRWLEVAVARLFERSEIYRIDDDGEVDPTRHEVVEMRPATDDAIVNHIAATVRPGYAWRRQILRPQEVVAYVPGDSQ